MKLSSSCSSHHVLPPLCAEIWVLLIKSIDARHWSVTFSLVSTSQLVFQQTIERCPMHTSLFLTFCISLVKSASRRKCKRMISRALFLLSYMFISYMYLRSIVFHFLYDAVQEMDFIIWHGTCYWLLWFPYWGNVEKVFWFCIPCGDLH